MRQTTRSRTYSFRKAIFAPAPRRWALTRFPRSFPNWTVLGKKDRRSLEVAAAVPWFWKKDRQSLPTFVSFVYVSMGGMSGKHSAELKRRGDEDNTGDGEINVKVSDFTKQVQNHLKWLSHSVRFWEKNARRVILCFSVQNDQGKKVWDNRIWTRQVPSWFSIRDIALLAMIHDRTGTTTVISDDIVCVVKIKLLLLRPCGFFGFSSGSESKINAGGRKEKKQKKKTASHPMYPANQQNLDTQLATAKLLLAIHSARNSAEAKTLHSDCLTVKRDPLRKHVQPQIDNDIDHWSLSAWRLTV